MIEIRRAGPDDIAAIAQAHVEADWETYSALFGPQAYKTDLGESEDRWRCALREGDILLVADDRSKIVGLGHAGKDEIGALYVLRSHQRRGIGRALLLHLLKNLNERGVAAARFGVVAANLNAISFYISLGAYPLGRNISATSRDASEELVFAISTSAAG